MSVEPLIHALALPSEARVDQRVPKKLLLEQAALTAADHRLIQQGLDSLTWIAALKPATVGVPVYVDQVREYLEIAVVAAVLRTGAKPARLVELIHRAIPYPLLLVVEQEGAAALSLAPKRRSEAETGQVVVEAVETTPLLRPESPTAEEAAFLAHVPLAAQPRRDLHALYEGWRGCVTALAAARVTGSYVLAAAPEQAAARRALLDEHHSLRRETDRLRAQAIKEMQLNRRVELNLEIRRLEGRIRQLQAEL